LNIKKQVLVTVWIRNLKPAKRETGANPARSRRCKRGILTKDHWETGKVVRVMMLEPEDLPVLNYRFSLLRNNF
jgi:hypothetical protein